MRVGASKVLDHPESGQPVDVSLPNDYSFADLNRAEVPEEDHTYFKPLHVDSQPGDCVYIPAYWWHQIEARYAEAPEEGAAEEAVAEHLAALKPLSVSVDFWYKPHSYAVENLF